MKITSTTVPPAERTKTIEIVGTVSSCNSLALALEATLIYLCQHSATYVGEYSDQIPQMRSLIANLRG